MRRALLVTSIVAVVASLAVSARAGIVTEGIYRSERVSLNCLLEGGGGVRLEFAAHTGPFASTYYLGNGQVTPTVQSNTRRAEGSLDVAGASPQLYDNGTRILSWNYFGDATEGWGHVELTVEAQTNGGELTTVFDFVDYDYDGDGRVSYQPMPPDAQAYPGIPFNPGVYAREDFRHPIKILRGFVSSSIGGNQNLLPDSVCGIGTLSVVGLAFYTGI